MRRTLPIMGSLLISAIFLWLAVRGVSLDDILSSIRQANPGWIAVTLLLATAGLWSRAIRWQGLLGFRIAARPAFHIVNITALVNQLPLRAGEAARTVLATRAGVPLMTAATTIVVERLLDTLLVVIVLAIAVSRIPGAPPLATHSMALFSGAAVTGAAVLVGLAHSPAFAHSILAEAERRLPWLKRLPAERLLTHIIEGLQPLIHWRSLAHAVGWTLTAWAFSLGTFYTLYLAMGVEGDSLLTSAAMAMALASFSVAIPVSLAAIGPFQAAVRLAGEAANLPMVQATALGFLIHGVNFFAYALWGTVGIVTLSRTVPATGLQNDTNSD